MVSCFVYQQHIHPDSSGVVSFHVVGLGRSVDTTDEEFRDRVEGEDRKAGVSILMRSLSAPMMQIAKNAGTHTRCRSSSSTIAPQRALHTCGALFL